MAIRINDAEIPEPPFNSGTVLVFDDGSGRCLNLRDQQEALELAAAAVLIAENWNAA